VWYLMMLGRIVGTLERAVQLIFCRFFLLGVFQICKMMTFGLRECDKLDGASDFIPGS
jgi:hypothetical protein